MKNIGKIIVLVIIGSIFLFFFTPLGFVIKSYTAEKYSVTNNENTILHPDSAKKIAELDSNVIVYELEPQVDNFEDFLKLLDPNSEEFKNYVKFMENNQGKKIVFTVKKQN